MTGHPRGAIARPASGASRRRSGLSIADAARSGRLFAAITALAGLVLLYGFLLSGDFLISSVVVNGTRLGDPAEVVAVADTIGEPIFTVDAASAAERVATLPYIERASVSTGYPDEVTITVVERVPVAVWQSLGRSYLVDSSGNVLAERGDGQLPLVIDDVKQPVVGGRLDPMDVAAVISIRETFAERSVVLTRTRVEGFIVERGKQIIVLGGPEALPKKLAVWREVAALDRSWDYLDLREPDRPYYK